MTAKRISLVCIALTAIGVGWSRASAQDNPPIVDSEVISATPLGSSDKTTIDLMNSPMPVASLTARTPDVPSVESDDLQLKNGILQSILVPKPTLKADATKPAASNPGTDIPRSPLQTAKADAAKPAACPPHLGVPALGVRAMSLGTSASDVLGKLPPNLPSPSSPAPRVAESGQPSPLSPTDSQLFASASQPSAEVPVAENVRSVRPAPSNVSRMPKNSKIFSFDTIDKVTTTNVMPALGEFTPEVTLNLAGPDSVSVNQVFQQLVQVSNSSTVPQVDLRVTQVCDLAVLGAERHQVVTIDCLAPGETKTVRFSARALQAGPFFVRYIAENSEIQADVDNLVQVSESNLTIKVDGPTAMQTGDGGDYSIAIHNPLTTEWNDVWVRCKSPASAQIQVFEHEAVPDSRDGSVLIHLSRLNPQTTETIRLRIVPTETSEIRLDFAVESQSRQIDNQTLDVSVLPPPR